MKFIKGLHSLVYVTAIINDKKSVYAPWQFRINFSTCKGRKTLLCQMHHFVVDIGNSRIKLGLFEAEELMQTWVFSEVSKIAEIIASKPARQLLISSVSKERSRELVRRVSESTVVISFEDLKALPFSSKYKTPETLGKDRIAVIAFAEQKYKHIPVLVIDAGTCITYDYLSEDGVHLGGAIAPGLKMRFSAVSDYTSALPMIEVENQSFSTDMIGDSTNSCIEKGVFGGYLSEVNQRIAEFKKNDSNGVILFCGGDADKILPFIQEKVIYQPQLVLLGINHVLLNHEAI